MLVDDQYVRLVYMYRKSIQAEKIGFLHENQYKVGLIAISAKLKLPYICKEQGKYARMPTFGKYLCALLENIYFKKHSIW